jgi:hypothetical protein
LGALQEDLRHSPGDFFGYLRGRAFLEYFT